MVSNKSLRTSLRTSVRTSLCKSAAVCAAVVMVGAAAAPAGALPAPQSPSISVPASPEVPSAEDIAAAKSSEAAAADQVAAIERILGSAAESQQAAFAVAMQANNAYSEALVELQQRSTAAATASARATAAQEQQDKTRKQVGQLAGDLYRNGGLNPTLGTLASGGGETLQQAATLQALSASRSRAFEAADAAAEATRSQTAAAEEATTAADEAARTAETRKSQADEANAASAKAVADAKAQRTVLVDQLAQLRNTTADLPRVVRSDLRKELFETICRNLEAVGLEVLVEAQQCPSDARQQSEVTRPLALWQQESHH